jgi:pimeloyl-ACP methyl ester carboxylesterase
MRISHALYDRAFIGLGRRARFRGAPSCAKSDADRPFTTLREEAATILSGWLARLLIESYDNRVNLAEAEKRNPAARIAIFHGTNDEVIPIRMGRELAREFPFVEFFEVEDANHVSVLNYAHDKIINWMSR